MARIAIFRRAVRPVNPEGLGDHIDMEFQKIEEVFLLLTDQIEALQEHIADLEERVADLEAP